MISYKRHKKDLECWKSRGDAHRDYFAYPFQTSPLDIQFSHNLEWHDSSSSSGFFDFISIVCGLTVFTFFLISSCFIVNGVVRHIYTDHVLPKRHKILKKLGKQQLESQQHHKSLVQDTREPGREYDEGSSSKTKAKGYRSDKPYYLDDYSTGSENSISSSSSQKLFLAISESSPPVVKQQQSEPVKAPVVPGMFGKLPDIPADVRKPRNDNPEVVGVKRKVPKVRSSLSSEVQGISEPKTAVKLSSSDPSIKPIPGMNPETSSKPKKHRKVKRGSDQFLFPE